MMLKICRMILAGGVMALGFLLITPILLAQTKDFSVMNAHEHIESEEAAVKYLAAAEPLGIKQTVILGSPEITFKPNTSSGFKEFDANNQMVLKLAGQYPDQFIPFVTIDPQDKEKLEKLKAYVEEGAQGLKLFSGHVEFHKIPLDDPAMNEIYEYCQNQNIPVIFHVNAGYYLKEFDHVLNAFPEMKVICPHFCLSSIAEERFRYLMDFHPNLYTDVSFGQVSNVISALNRISQDPEKFKRLILQYQDRIFFGTDMVVSNDEARSKDWLYRLGRAYRDMLEKETFEFYLAGPGKLKGLHLKPAILKKIYQENFEAFMALANHPKEIQAVS